MGDCAGAVSSDDEKPGAAFGPSEVAANFVVKFVVNFDESITARVFHNPLVGRKGRQARRGSDLAPDDPDRQTGQEVTDDGKS